MGTLAWIVGFIGGLCMVMGLITITEVAPSIGEQFTWTFWFFISAIFLLMAIAFGVGGGGRE